MSDDKTDDYHVADGVDWVNGKRVPKSRKVELTKAEAKFDLDHGRISSKPFAKPTPKGGEAGKSGQAADKG